MEIVYKMNKITHRTLLKVLVIGAAAQILLTLFYRALYALTQNQLPNLLLAILDPILFEPLLLFLVSFIAFRTYYKFIELKYVSFTIGAYVLLGWLAAFNILEIISQKTFVFYSPSLLSLIAPILGSYMGSKSYHRTRL